MRNHLIWIHLVIHNSKLNLGFNLGLISWETVWAQVKRFISILSSFAASFTLANISNTIKRIYQVWPHATFLLCGRNIKCRKKYLHLLIVHYRDSSQHISKYSTCRCGLAISASSKFKVWYKFVNFVNFHYEMFSKLHYKTLKTY